MDVRSTATGSSRVRPATGFDSVTTILNPFDSELARRNSRYYGTKGGRAILLSHPGETPDLFASAAVGAFRGFVLNPAFSCVGAKSAVMHESYRIGVYDQLGGAGETAGLCRDLFTFAREVAAAGRRRRVPHLRRDLPRADRRRRAGVRTAPLGAAPALNRHDAPTTPGTRRSATTPRDPHFGFSFAETALFIVGLHPHSSREARRFPWPTLVFNPHAQFQHLREEGRWDRLQQVIRDREEQLQGSLNPNLADSRDGHRGPPVFRPGGRGRLARAVLPRSRRPGDRRGVPVPGLRSTGGAGMTGS